jgi:hypothetical protein
MKLTPGIGLLIFASLIALLLPRSGQCFYNSAEGRWLSRDPIAERGGINLYELSRNDPISNVDKNGTCCRCLLVKYGTPDSTVSDYVSPGSPPPPAAPADYTLNLYLKVPYTILVVGNKSECKCKYVDNGTIDADMAPAHGPPFSGTRPFNNETTPIPCQSGEDDPGIYTGVPEHGGPLKYSMTFNWTGTLWCMDSFGGLFNYDTVTISRSFGNWTGVTW